MRILHLRASNFYGGPERQLHRHALLARRDGFEPVVASFSENEKTPEFLTVIAQDGIETHTFPVASAYDRSAIRKLSEYLREKQTDILCTHDYRTHIVGMLAGGKPDMRWIAFSRGWTRENVKIRFYHFLDKIFIRNADHIVAVSEAQKRKLVRLFIPSRKITVVLNAINLPEIEAVPPVDLRRRFGFGSDDVICVAAGRFSAEKGQLDLIRAAELVSKRADNVRFVLFGDGPDLEGARQLIEKIGLRQTVYCPGFEPDVIGCLKSADILVNPSHSEGLPNILLEGIACGLAIVATDVGGQPEVVTHMKDGILVPPRDPAAIASAIGLLVDDRSLRTRLAGEGNKVLAARFSFETQNQELTRLYKKVISR